MQKLQHGCNPNLVWFSGQTPHVLLYIMYVHFDMASIHMYVLSELAGVIKVLPQRGALNPHLHKGKLSQQHVEVTFSPK